MMLISVQAKSQVVNSHCIDAGYSDLLMKAHHIPGHVSDTFGFDPYLSWPEPPTSYPLQYFDPCTNSNNKRGVAFVHGLGGSIAAWDKQIQFTDNTYNTACFGVDYSSAPYEVSFHQVAIELKNDLNDGFGDLNDWYYNTYNPNTNRCINDDYVIAHSQGGIAARFLDMKWNNSSSGTFGSRSFYGLVTFGTPHQGADVGLSQDKHYAFVQKVVSSIVLDEFNEKMYDLSSGFIGTFLNNQVYNLKGNLDDLIENELAPLMLSSVHTATLNEMTPGSNMLADLNTASSNYSKLHRVAFYGIEDAPECWRVMDNMVTKKAEDYALWGAQPDGEFLAKMEEIRAKHILKIDYNKKLVDHKIKWRDYSAITGIGLIVTIIENQRIVALNREINARQKTVDFLNSANTEWRYLIGSYKDDTVNPVTKYKVSYTARIPTGGSYNGGMRYIEMDKVLYFDNIQDANKVANAQNGTVTQVIYARMERSYYPSDGVVLSKSALGYPGVLERDVDLLRGNNHFQLRNSLETERVLTDLYDGNVYDQYFMLY